MEYQSLRCIVIQILRKAEWIKLSRQDHGKQVGIAFDIGHI